MKTLEAFDKFLKGKSLSKPTVISYTYAWKHLAEFSPELPEYTGDINAFTKWLSETKHYRDISVHGYLRSVKIVYRYLAKNYHLPNPAQDAEKIKVVKRRRRYLTSSELIKVISACKNEYDLALTLTLIDSACRIGELVHLKGKDVLEDRILVTGKTGQRTYRLDSKVCKMLHSLAGTDDSYVFKPCNQGNHTPIDNGRPNTSDNLGNRINHIMLRAGLTGEKLRPHTLRHSSASLVAKETGSQLMVKSLLQHDDIKTSSVYMHDVDTELQQKVSPLGLIMSSLPVNPAVKQSLLLTDGSENPSNQTIIESDTPLTNTIDDLIASQFSIANENTHIRPLLHIDDINLIRRAFICLCQFGQITTDANSARNLYNRMLRKSSPQGTAT